jgi:hypothetical protein
VPIVRLKDAISNPLKTDRLTGNLVLEAHAERGKGYLTPAHIHAL